MSLAPPSCTLCPRLCRADRLGGALGRCGGGALPRVARAALHHWEEPCISGSRGSGTVFFSGCPLGCRFCQNSAISAGNFGREITSRRLADIFLELQDQGAHNVNLVSPTQYVPWILEALALARPALTLPVVYNTGGYERVETLRALEGAVDVYLPDLKYSDPARAGRYSQAWDYVEAARAAVLECYRQTGPLELDGEGMLRRGLVVRHLVLPGGAADSLAVLDWLAASLPLDGFYLSLMSQYTPCRADGECRELNRRVSTYEYNRVARRAQELGFEGYLQERGAARGEYTPPFDLEGV